MRKYEKLLEYISYFEDNTDTFCTWESTEDKGDNTIVLGYPKYDDKLRQFIDNVCETDLMKSDYLEYLENHITNLEEIKKSIEIADLELLRAILTYYVRQERFCEGLWVVAAREKIFLSILYRLQKLLIEE